MPIKTAQRVLWVSLLIILPLPFYSQNLAWVPIGRIVQLLIRGVLPEAGLAAALLCAQAIIWSIVLWLMALLYGATTKAWPAKIRGSIMGLMVLTLLMLFSSMPIYYALAPPGQTALTFLQVYH